VSVGGTRETVRRPVTVLATRVVRAGCEADFEAFLGHLERVFAASPGHLGLTVIRPVAPDREYALVYRYDSPASLRAWEASAERGALIAESAQLTQTPPRERRLTGLETWFTARGRGVVAPPARWKMWILSACGIYPVITIVTVLAGPLLLTLSPPLRFAIVSPLLSAIMTWLVMPALSRLFGGFLYGR
jgi:uncharacterized protein